MITFKQYRKLLKLQEAFGYQNPAFKIKFGNYRNDAVQQSASSRENIKNEENGLQKGTRVSGKELKTDKIISGNLISIRKDEQNNILYYFVRDEDTGELYKLDPSSVNTKDDNNK